VRVHAGEWNIDAKRIALLGGSAGGHLATWVGLQKDAQVSGIVDLWGPSDLSAISPRVPRGEALTALFDTTAEQYENPDPALRKRIAEASPVTYVHRGAPPVFIAHEGPADATSPSDPRISGKNMGVHSAAFGLILAHRLKPAGVTYQLYIDPKCGSNFQPRALEFLRRVLRLPDK